MEAFRRLSKNVKACHKVVSTCTKVYLNLQGVISETQKRYSMYLSGSNKCICYERTDENTRSQTGEDAKRDHELTDIIRI